MHGWYTDMARMNSLKDMIAALVEEETQIFRLECKAYRRMLRQGWSWCAGYMVAAGLALTGGLLLLPTYTHIWTPYLKWQDALVSLLCFIGLLGLAGATFVLRFLYALRAGYTTGILHLNRDHTIAVRDLSHENFISIFWMMHAAFWCFILVLLGLSPEILLRWTLHLANPMLAFFTTALVVLLSLAGMVLCAVFGFFILVGCVGLFNTCRNLGALYTYKLDNRINIRLDDSNLTIIYPDKPEAMLDLNVLKPEERQRLFALLQECDVEVQCIQEDVSDESQVAMLV